MLRAESANLYWEGTMDAIPLDVGLKLCGQIRDQTRGKLISLARWQCWGCLSASKGDPARMCVGSRPDGRGCNLVNARYARQAEQN
jgi:hypothetical protein